MKTLRNITLIIIAILVFVAVIRHIVSNKQDESNEQNNASEKTEDYNDIEFSEDQGKLLYLLVEDEINRYVNSQNSNTTYGRKKPNIIRVQCK